jgi:uncharacterized protein (DUF924 family)
MEKVFDFWFKNAFKTIVKDSKTLVTFDDSLSKSLFQTWFGSSAATDEWITKEFKDELLKISQEEQSATNPKETLSKVIILDQFSRNIFRNSKKMFDFDQKALQLSLEAIDRGFDHSSELHPMQTVFFYLPLEHSEDLKMQEQSVQKFKSLSNRFPEIYALKEFEKYALEHYDLVKKFNRFPHRNKLLGRENTSDEDAYLSAQTSVFGVQV